MSRALAPNWAIYAHSAPSGHPAGATGVAGTMRPDTNMVVVQLPERSPPPLHVTWNTSDVPPMTSIGDTHDTRLSPFTV